MRSEYTGRFFIESLKKKPKYKVHYDNLANYSLEEISKLDIPLWYRERLTELKKQNYVPSEQNERLLSLRDVAFKIKLNPNVKGKIYSSKDSWYLKINKTEQLLDPGSLIFVSSVFMLVDGMFKNNLNDLDLVLKHCEFIEETDELSYRSAVREIVNEKVV